MSTRVRVVVIYDGRGAAIEAMAGAVYEGASESPGAEASLKRIDRAARRDLLDADAIIMVTIYLTQ